MRAIIVVQLLQHLTIIRIIRIITYACLLRHVIYERFRARVRKSRPMFVPDKKTIS